MNKLKIFFISALMVLSSCIGVFANENSRYISNTLDDKTYFIKYISSNTGNYVTYTFNTYNVNENGIVVISSPNLYYYNVSTQKYSFEGSKSELIIMESADNITVNKIELLNAFKDSSYYEGFTIKIGNYFINGESQVVPPVIAPTVSEAIAKILPDFLVQLKKLLPTGVMLFAILLGVRLVPRLIRLFQ